MKFSEKDERIAHTVAPETRCGAVALATLGQYKRE
jgi:hypothetical protein